MPRFQRRLNCDTGYPDGILFLYMPGATTTATLSSLALAGAVTFNITLDHLLLRSGLSDDLQEAFGGGATSQVFSGARGLPSPPAVFSTPAGVSGAPPFAGISQFTPVTAARPKGIQITSITPIATATTAIVSTFTLNQVAFVNGVAPAVTALINALSAPVPISTDNVTPIAVPTPPWLNNLNAQYILNWTITAGVGTLYGIRLGVQFNYC
jgi:hypothetical protein